MGSLFKPKMPPLPPVQPAPPPPSSELSQEEKDAIAAEQRATFMGMEFDQAFQSRVPDFPPCLR